MLRVIAVDRHGDIDVERALNVLQLRRPHVGERGGRGVDGRTGLSPLCEVARLSDLNVAAGSVGEVV